VFLLSIPRAGSTLLQRMLGAHESIATASEPWFLLPLLYALREPGARAEYDHVTMVNGVRSFAADYLPGGVEAYRAAVRSLALDLYEQAAGGRPFFLDKTPRYGHVARDLVELFPEGRFVFLWRNPLASAASMVETFAAGRWNLARDPQRADFAAALPQLVDTYLAHVNRCHALRYEDLVRDPEREVRAVLGYLGLPHDPTLVSRFVELPAPNAYADPGGTRAHGRVTAERLEAWRPTMSTWYRKRWCRSLLLRLGSERIAAMGYDLDGLLAEVDALPGRLSHLGPDLRAALGARVRTRLGA
jgi:hypothetical protein